MAIFNSYVSLTEGKPGKFLIYWESSKFQRDFSQMIGLAAGLGFKVSLGSHIFGPPWYFTRRSSHLRFTSWISLELGSWKNSEKWSSHGFPMVFLPWFSHGFQSWAAPIAMLLGSSFGIPLQIFGAFPSIVSEPWRGGQSGDAGVAGHHEAWKKA